MIGYCCINQTLRKQSVYTGRMLIRRKFSMEIASKLALQNAQDLLTILQWNADHDIRAFRLGSGFFPRITDPETSYCFEDLSTSKQIETLFQEAGKLAQEHSMILSCHPGPYTVLSSDDPVVAEKSVEEIHMHSLIGDLLGVDQFNINFHVGRKQSVVAADNFCRSLEKLSPTAASRVVVENDDKPSGFSVFDLYELIHQRTGVPITFDVHHSQFSRNPDMPIEEEYRLAKSTCGSRPAEVHISESAEGNNPRKHSDYILNPLPEWLDVDSDFVLFEAKQKELAVLKYREKCNDLIH